MDDYYRAEVHELRKRYKLDKKAAGAKDRWEALLRLSNWIGGLCEFGSPPEEVPLNAFAILDAMIKKGYKFNCSQIPSAFAQVAHAMGYGVRDVFLGWDGDIIRHGHHGATEVWVDGLDKWVYVDALHRLHCERDGVPLSTYEIRRAGYENDVEGVYWVQGEDRRTYPFPPDTTVKAQEEVYRLYRAGKIPGPYPTPGLFFWFCVNMNNAHFANLHHNPESWFNVLLFRDRHNAEKVWYQRLHKDAAAKTYHWVYWSCEMKEVWSEYQLNFPLNQVHIDWRQGKDRCLDLSFETTCPNFSHFLIEIDRGKIRKIKEPNFKWELHKGSNRLRVRAVNFFGVRATPSELKAIL